MKTIHRIISLFLILSSLFSTLSCGDNEGITNDTTSPDNADSNLTDTYQYAGHDLKGKTYVFLNCPKDLWSMHNTIQPDELNGDAINDAMYNRNEYVKSKLNCDIKEKNASDIDNVKTLLSTSVLAGDDEYQIAYMPMFHNMTAISGEWLYCLNNFDELRLDQPYWSQELINATSINGKNYFATSSLHLMSIDGIWCMFFNQAMMDDLKLEYPYQLVRDGKWTLDKLTEYSRAAANLNGDSSFALNSAGKSIYGTVSIAHGMQKFLYGAQAEYIVKDKEDQPVSNLKSSSLIDTLQKYARFFGAEGVFMNAQATQSFEAYAGGVTPYIGLFMSNRALFIGTEIKVANTLRPMEQSFGVVPFPKIDENQSNYRSTALHQLCTATIPVTNTDAANTALLLDALSYESDRQVLESYLVKTVEQKGLRNEESIEMLKLIRETLSFDLGIAYQLVTPLENALKEQLLEGNDDIASQIAAHANTVNSNLEKLLAELDT